MLIVSWFALRFIFRTWELRDQILKSKIWQFVILPKVDFRFLNVGRSLQGIFRAGEIEGVLLFTKAVLPTVPFYLFIIIISFVYWNTNRMHIFEYYDFQRDNFGHDILKVGNTVHTG